jgi:hypothetical protein
LPSVTIHPSKKKKKKAYADKFKRDVIFNEGDEVLLSTKNIKIKIKGTPKLLPKWLTWTIQGDQNDQS